ncbi:hypothetical protein B0H15DRAFT_993824 [Mycena belliarum]|uniref:BHLH domain-containing protein n=1 Tax=Mycena belliarum TaxID=1033014 RepID=A0AAD6U2C0_9AGAR|nr:hypothetical protein B0H15DRAFT_993824 [Mycena belliae]
MSLSSSPTPSTTSSALMLPSMSLVSDMDDFSGRMGRRDRRNSDGDSVKPRERDSSAARRASHNAVERQRRDKLNARILELASLLPNLAGVRRPSRIAITRSSIAHIYSARRHRILAAQQLRALHAEVDALRSEVNQWRQRAGIPITLEPPRSEAFMTVFTGAELELDPVDVGEEEECDERFAHGVPFGYAHGPTIHPAPPALGYGGSPPSSASSGSPYSTPPSSGLPAYVKYEMGMAPPEPHIACPTPATAYEQHFVLKKEEEQWALYGAPPTHFEDQAPASW